MYKFYAMTTLALATAFSAAAINFGAAQTSGTLMPATQNNVSIVSGLSAKADSRAEAQRQDRSNLSRRHNAPSEGEWVSLGKGQFVDDLLTIYNGFPASTSVEVEIFQNSAQPGWYRLNPYAEGVAQNIVSANFGNLEGDIYINATDPNKVYMEEFQFANLLFSSYAPEGGWEFEDPTEAFYGTLADNVITFGSNSIAAWDGASGYLCCRNEGTIIRLPGAKDYTVSANVVNNCLDDEGKLYANLNIGADVASFYILTLGDYMEITEELYPQVVEVGTPFQGYNGLLKYSFAPQNTHGFTTFCIVGVDAEGNIVGGACDFACQNKNDGEWGNAGTVVWTDQVMAPGYGVEPETFENLLEFDVASPSRFRVVNPYASTEIFDLSEHAHFHYLYIDASDKDHVVMEPSILGTAMSGEAVVWNYVDYFGAMGYDAATVEAALGITYGKMSDEGVITFPAQTLILSERGYRNGVFTTANQEPLVFTLKLGNTDDPTAVGSLEAEDAAPVYYNLQGVRLSEPTGLCVKVAAGKAVKVVK